MTIAGLIAAICTLALPIILALLQVRDFSREHKPR